MSGRYAAIIFDFDGVLVDSEPLHEWAIRESVRGLGWHGSFTRERFYAEIVGRGDENAYRKIAEWNGDAMPEARLGELLRAKWALMGRGIEEGRYTIQAGAVEAMGEAKRLGRIAVCSGSVRGTVEPLLVRMGVRGSLDALVCGDDVARMKPAPDGYLRAAELMGVKPAECLAIEDTPTGVASARAAGMRVVAVCHTMGRERLGEADEVVARIAEVRLR
jgi:HAD superfamily hydrolase (TIGR01509 family)